jgi:primosomal protein N'
MKYNTVTLDLEEYLALREIKETFETEGSYVYHYWTSLGNMSSYTFYTQDQAVKQLLETNTKLEEQIGVLLRPEQKKSSKRTFWSKWF